MIIAKIIISDNNSRDKTIQIIQSFNSNKIKIYTHEKKGVISNFENGLKHASGEIIFPSDQDDVWFGNKITVMKVISLLYYDLVMSDCIIVDENLAVLDDSFFATTKANKGLIKNFFRNTIREVIWLSKKKY